MLSATLASLSMAAVTCKILILDFGAQYTQLIARRLRETHVYARSIPATSDDEFVRASAEGHHLSGGPTAYEGRHAAARPHRVVDSGVPVLGIATGCRRWPRSWAAPSRPGGARIRLRGGPRPRAHAAPSGIRTATTRGHGLLDVWMSHGDKVTALPPGSS
jgi:GMP synthase (glutamine-hydrolysing)